MDTGKNDCIRFEVCENVIAALLSRNGQLEERVFTCLFCLYRQDCMAWLIKKYGRQPPGQADEHNAGNAFADALLALYHYINAGRFSQQLKPHACRRFIYAVSRRIFWKLRFNKFDSGTSLKGISPEDILKNPEPFFTFPLEREEEIQKLHEVIKSMPPPCRELLWMKYVDDLSIDEIAEKTGQDKQRVTRQLYDCREKIKKLL
jgi:RNA polymerase sigma factor (sigma-70 family)